MQGQLQPDTAFEPTNLDIVLEATLHSPTLPWSIEARSLPIPSPSLRYVRSRASKVMLKLHLKQMQIMPTQKGAPQPSQMG